MDKKCFDGIMLLIVPEVINLIIEEGGYDERTATLRFYESKLYSFYLRKRIPSFGISVLYRYIRCLMKKLKRGRLLFLKGRELHE